MRDEALPISRTARIIEVASVIAFWTLEIALFVRVFAIAPLGLFGWIVTLAGAYLLADFVSGLVHWAADTYGASDTFLVGPLFVRSFRQHHVEPEALARHDLFENMGGNCAISLPFFAVHFLGLEKLRPSLLICIAFLGAFLFFIAMTAMSHRWAHDDDAPRIARIAQRLGLIVGVEHHARHHEPPHLVAYCITAGIWNPLLDRVQFFRRLEAVIAVVTGLRAREDDSNVKRSHS